jgi:hypothetical protein
MNLKELQDKGYMILNGIINDISIIRDNNKLLLILSINGDGWSVEYGQYDLNDDLFMGTQSLVDLLLTLDINNLYDIKGKNVRIAAKIEETVTIIGNIMYDKWFNYMNYKIEPVTMPVDTETEDKEEEVEE